MVGYLFYFFMFASDDRSVAARSEYVPGPPALPVKGVTWERMGFGLKSLEFDHGWLVRYSDGQQMSMAFILRPENHSAGAP
jgi:hypothetical protein